MNNGKLLTTESYCDFRLTIGSKFQVRLQVALAVLIKFMN